MSEQKRTDNAANKEKLTSETHARVYRDARTHQVKGGPTPRRASADGHASSARGSAVRSPLPPNTKARRVSHNFYRPNKGKIVSAVLAVVLTFSVVGGAAGWWFMWRDISVTVNDEQKTVRVGTSLSDFLKDNDNFGVKPGRLLSIGGNVINETDGEACTVNFDGELLKSNQIPKRTLRDGDVMTVTQGADKTEASEERTDEVAPGIEMKSGGSIQYVSQWGHAGKKKVLVGKTSGETIDKETLEEPVNMVVESVNLNPQDDSGTKYMALTFDDGPSTYTPQILDVLASKGVKATFFNLGNSANSYPDYTKRVLSDGHELASHTMQHQNLPNLDRDALRNEITNAFNVLNGASGGAVQMMRAPYGAFTDKEWARAGDLISCNVLWNIDTLDWKRPGASAITDMVLSHAKNGRIVLMHDGGGDRSQDIEALPGIIDGLQAAGYKLVTVGELMKLDGTIPEDVVNGTVSMPEGASLPNV